MSVRARWEDPAEDAVCTQWARKLFREAAPYATGDIYVNFMPDDETDRIGSLRCEL